MGMFRDLQGGLVEDEHDAVRAPVEVYGAGAHGKADNATLVLVGQEEVSAVSGALDGRSSGWFGTHIGQVSLGCVRTLQRFLVFIAI
jgi:hypothetical protein